MIEILVNKLFKQSQNHRMASVGRDLKDLLVPVPLPWAGMPPTRSCCLGPHLTWSWNCCYQRIWIYGFKNYIFYSLKDESQTAKLWFEFRSEGRVGFHERAGLEVNSCMWERKTEIFLYNLSLVKDKTWKVKKNPHILNHFTLMIIWLYHSH